MSTDFKNYFADPSDRSERGSAPRVIAEEKRLQAEKTERLRALRLAKEQASSQDA